MHYTGFPVTNSTLKSQALIERVLSKYKLPSTVRCNFLSLGVNDTYRVKAGSSTYYLRVYRFGWRTKAEIQAELDMLTYLHRRHLPVSYPLKRKDGQYLNRIAAPEGIRYAALFTNAPGEQKSLNIRQSDSYGELAAQMHACLDKAPDDDRRFHLDSSHFIDEPLQLIAPFLDHRKKDLDYLDRVGHELWLKIDDLLPEKKKPEYGCCHGDHHGYNVNIDKDDRMVVYDFDCYGYGWRAYDIAVFLWNRSFDLSKAGKAKKTRRWNSFLNGYSKVRPLSARELEATMVFLPIRHIWLLGLHSQLSESLGTWVNDGYFDRNIDLIKRWIDSYKIL